MEKYSAALSSYFLWALVVFSLAITGTRATNSTLPETTIAFTTLEATTDPETTTEPGGCEAVLVAEDDVKSFTTPNYPLSYPDHLNCVWIVTSGDTKKHVEVLFTPLDTEACCDFIKVRDGVASNSPLLLPMSGNKTRSSYFFSTYDTLYITFDSDDSVTGGGFRVEYRIAQIEGPADCGGDLTATQKYQDITSPGLGQRLAYGPNEFCLWTISAPAGHKVELAFISYRLEPCCDSVLLRDGAGEEAKTIAYVRGAPYRNQFFTAVEVYHSTGNKMQVRFRSDGSKQYGGFIASFRLVPPENGTSNGTAVETVVEQAASVECGKELDAPMEGHGNFTTPNFPRYHPGEVSCTWVIRAPEGKRVRVWFSYINTEGCCDWIKVRDGEAFDSPKIGVISGNSKRFDNFVSSLNVIRVEFDSDDTVNKRGFFAYYEIYRPTLDASTSSCGGDLVAGKEPLYFSSPNFPHGTYPASTSCIWVITSPFETRVQVEILGIILENMRDVLTFHDGQSSLSRALVRITGKQPGKFRVTSSANALTLMLHADDVNSHAGFRATYEAVEGKPQVEEETDDVGPK